METAALIASGLIGVTLGLIGGGGSIMTVPVLVYLFGLSPLLSTSYSLFIVGTTSLVGAVNSYRRGLVDIPTAFSFSIASVLTVFLTRKFIIPLLPGNMFSIGSFTVTEPVLMMVLFALLMVTASLSMIKKDEGPPKVYADNNKNSSAFKFLLYGTGIGLITGFLGAGGGFLLIPTLVLLLGLQMKQAIGTSLLIISFNSLTGFAADLGHFSIDWPLLLKITGIAVSGLFAGSYLNRKTDAGKLKRGFGWFVLIMGIYIIIKEAFF